MASTSHLLRQPCSEVDAGFSTSNGTKRPDSGGPSTWHNDSSASESNASQSKKRKLAKSVTFNACNNCKKARAKCDGAEPCDRCKTRQLPQACQYQLHTKAAKGQMIDKIQQLQVENQRLRHQNHDLKERNERNDLLEAIFETLRDDSRSQEVLCRLKRGDDYQSVLEWLGQTSSPQLDFIPELPFQQDLDGIWPFPQQWASSSPWQFLDTNFGV